MAFPVPPPGSLVVLGPALLDHVRGPGPALSWSHPGGNGLVFAGTAALLGAPVIFVGQRGDDGVGRALGAHLARHGVQIHAYRPVPGLTTKEAHIALEADGGWRTLSSTPARFPYLPRPALPTGAERVQIMGLTSLLRACPAELSAWIAGIRLAGLPLGFGLNALEPAEAPAVDALVGAGDAVFCNAGEWWAWRGQRVGPRDALTGGPTGDLVVSLGADGVLVRPAGGPTFHRPAPRVPARCTIGAGDVLCAATVTLRAAGLSLHEAIDEAQALAASRVTDLRWDDWAAQEPVRLAHLRGLISRSA